MKKESKQENRGPEVKKRIPVWLYPSTLEAMDRAMKLDNCKSRSELIENAVRFYAGYLSGEDATAYLPAALVAALRSTVRDSENRIARLLFKLSVETAMSMTVLAKGMEIIPEDLNEIREKCVRDVKRSNGAISLKDIAISERDYQ